MGIWEWLRDLPIVDDVADAFDIFAEFIPEAGSGAVLVGDYAELRQSMYWTIGQGGFDTRQQLLIDFSLEPVSYGENGQVAKGLWRDPHTGFESSNPSDFDVDHRVPFKETADQFPELYELPKDEQLAIYNDVENLQVVHDVHNLAKGDDAPAQHALELASLGSRREFLRKCADYVGGLQERFAEIRTRQEVGPDGNTTPSGRRT